MSNHFYEIRDMYYLSHSNWDKIWLLRMKSYKEDPEFTEKVIDPYINKEMRKYIVPSIFKKPNALKGYSQGQWEGYVEDIDYLKNKGLLEEFMDVLNIIEPQEYLHCISGDEKHIYGENCGGTFIWNNLSPKANHKAYMHLHIFPAYKINRTDRMQVCDRDICLQYQYVHSGISGGAVWEGRLWEITGLENIYKYIVMGDKSVGIIWNVEQARRMRSLKDDY